VTIAQLLQNAFHQGLDRLEAQRLLLHCLGRSGQDRAWLITHGEDVLPKPAEAMWERCLGRYQTGEPLAYITGHVEFYGLNLQVDKRVLVPRADTETLVDWALATWADHRSAQMMDLGTGSGAIALALKSQRPDWAITAIDASRDALAVAQANAARLRLDVAFRLGSWLDGLEGDQANRFDAIVSNPPYVAQDDPHLLALTHEPTVALASGSDGLADIRTIVAQARAHLHPGGWLLLEHGYDQAKAVRGLLQAAGFKTVQSRLDLAGIERCSGGCV
jgi:release factor glutamine methyltransferase